MSYNSQVLTNALVSRINISRKRPLNLLLHKNFVAEKNRNSGRPYVERNGVYHEGLRPPAVVINLMHIVF